MDKNIILAVAGSGKTTLIVDELNLNKRFLIITYTINNNNNLKESIIKKFGYFPENIDLQTYYNFLYSFCFRPFLAYKIRPTGIYFENPPDWTNRLPRNSLKYYLSSDGRLYHNRIAKMLNVYNVDNDVVLRLEKYYDCLMIDEVQDFAGHDFNLLKTIATANIEMKFVGDFYQHTFDTSRDGNTNINLHTNYDNFKKEFVQMGVDINDKYLNKSYRCSPSVCDFIKGSLGIEISSHKTEDSVVYFIEKIKIIDEIYNNYNIVKLFYKESYKYNCYAANWGDSKGQNCYNDVCVVLNKTTTDYYKKDKLFKLNPVSKNKFYVACSRARENLYLIPEELIKQYKITN